MLRLQHTIIAHLTIVLVLVSLLLPTSSTNAATLDRPQTQAKNATRSPLSLLLTASPTGNKTTKLTIILETSVALDDIRLKLGVASGLTLVSTTLPTQTVLIAGQRLTYDAVVNINDVGPQDVEVLAWGSHANRVFTQLASLRLETVAGKITSRPSPASSVAAPTNAPDIPTTQSVPGDVEVNVTLTGQLRYHDHATRPIVTGVTTPGLDTVATVRPIRRARVQLQHRVAESATDWFTYSSVVAYTDDTGIFTITVPLRGCQTIRLQVHFLQILW